MKDDADTIKRKKRTRRLVILIGIILIAAWAGTQYTAHVFTYDEALGFNVGGIYPPFMLGWWYIQWGSGADYQSVFAFAGKLAMVVCAAGFLVFVIIENILKNSATNKLDAHGTARYADYDDIVSATLLPHPDAKDENGMPVVHEGVYVGGWVNPKTKKMVYLRHNGKEHILCYAPTRSGKGVGLVNPTLLSWKHSAVITDIKGELWELTAGWRQKFAKNKVIRFEPAAENSAGWNVFDSIRFGTISEERDVGIVASLIVDPDGKGLQDHWAKTAQSLIVGCILHVHYMALKDPKLERSLAAVDAMLSNPKKPLPETWKEMKENKHITTRNGVKLAEPETQTTVAQAGQDMLDRADAEGASVLSTAKSFLSLYRDPIIRRNTSKSDFTINQIANHDDPVSVYIITKPADLARIRPIFRLFISMVIGILADELKKVDGRMEATNKHRTLLMLDEFPSLGKLDVMVQALAFIAGFELKAYLISQDLSQLNAAYGKDESITSNCHVTIAYPPNRMDTAKYISDQTGGTTIMEPEISISGKRTGFFQNNVTTNMRKQARSLMTPDEVMRMKSPQKDVNGNITKPGEMLIFCAGQPVIKGQQILYFKDEAFLKRSKIPAPEISDCLMTAAPQTVAPPVETTTTKFDIAKPELEATDESLEPEPPTTEEFMEMYPALFIQDPEAREKAMKAAIDAYAEQTKENTDQDGQGDASWTAQQKTQNQEEPKPAEPLEPGEAERRNADALDGLESL